jgi:parvulin-like peptidyl-prolyl isomerase
MSEPPRLRASAARVIRSFFASCALFAFFAVQTTAQQLLDRVVARVGAVAITQSDVDSALAFGIVEPKSADGRDPVKQMIDRRLILDEVTRFPPPEPAEGAVNEQLGKMKAAAGAEAAAVMKRTGVDEKRLSEFARETLRIERYIAQRFGSGSRAEQQRAQWLDGLRARGDITEVTTRP